METKRTFIALALIMLIFTISNFVFKPKPRPKTNAKQVEASQVAQPEQTNIQTNLTEATELSTSNIPVNNEIFIQNNFLKLRFSNKGANLKAIELIEKTENNEFKYNFNNKAVQLLKQQQNPNGLANLTLIKTSGDVNGNKVFTENLVFSHELIYDADKAIGVNFFIEQEGTHILTKTFKLKNEYELDFSIGIENYPQHISGYDLNFATGMTDTEKFVKYKDQNYKVVASVESDIEKKDLARLKKEKQNWQGSIRWLAARTKYFMFGIIPNKRVEIASASGFAKFNSPAFDLNIRTQSGKIYQDTYTMYIGPINYDNLKKLGNDFENVAELGWKYTRFLSRWFIMLFNFLQRFVPNYGLIMIIFAIIMKLSVYPFTHKMFESSHKMQQIQPLLNEINAKYKDNPQKRMQEMQKIYKEHGVNPLKGCLPMLLQMPILLALYPVLRYSVDLRQAPFVGWLSDLSAPDPLFVLPILMGAFMVLQQMLMKPNTDKSNMDEQQLAQQKSQRLVGYIMPVMMVVIFRNLPSGLVLYYSTFNVLSIIQQILIKRKFQAKVG